MRGLNQRGVICMRSVGNRLGNKQKKLNLPKFERKKKAVLRFYSASATLCCHYTFKVAPTRFAAECFYKSWRITIDLN